MHCNLGVARATPVLSRFNYDAVPGLKSLNLSIAVLYRFAADTLLYAVTLTFYLEHLQCIACDMMKLCIKFELNRAIRGGVIAISIFDLITSNAV